MVAYLAELYRLGGSEEVVPPSALGAEMGVTAPAVARMAGRLEVRGLVDRIPYKGLVLTERGAREALRNIRYHRLAEAFLVTVLGYGWHEAHDLADGLAKLGDEVFMDRIEAKAGFPSRCPHGEPIPTRDGEMPEVNDVPLTSLRVGQRGIMSRIRTRHEDKLIYLAEVGLLPQTPVRVEARAPFQGPIRLRLNETELVIGSELAAELFVEVLPSDHSGFAA